MSYKIAGIEVHKKVLMVVVMDAHAPDLGRCRAEARRYMQTAKSTASRRQQWKRKDQHREFRFVLPVLRLCLSWLKVSFYLVIPNLSIQDQKMKNEKPNIEPVWKQFEDLLAPRLCHSAIDRAVYSHLFRHGRLEGKRQIQFSMQWLARGVCLTVGPVRCAVRRLLARGVLRLVPTKRVIASRCACPRRFPPSSQVQFPASRNSEDFIEGLDFMSRRHLRQAIHDREGGRCFYCRRPVTSTTRCLDHVVPRVEVENNSYRNLVSCCLECNSRKRGRSPANFLRWLHSQRRLTGAELRAGLHALNALVAGKFRPIIPSRGRAGNHG